MEMQVIAKRESDRLVLSSDVKTLRDISQMLITDGRFKALPSILNSIANDISDVIGREMAADDET